MQRLRQGNDAKVFVFDLEHEQKRREQLEKLFGRTKEQIDEENYLLEELKKIEIRKKERERKQQDVNKLLTAVVDLENINQNKVTQPSQPQSSSGIKHRNSVDSNNKRVKQRKYSTQSNNNESRNTTGIKSSNKNEPAVSANNSNSNSLNNSSEAINATISPASSTQNIETTRDSKNKKSLIFKVIFINLLN